MLESLQALPMGLLQAVPGNWPTAVLLAVGWVKIGVLVWAVVMIFKAFRGHGEMGDKFNEAIIPVIAFVLVLSPDLLMRVIGIGDNNAVMGLLSSWTLTP
jgi:hypothetical protein